MEKLWEESKGATPSQKILQGLAEKFSKPRERDGKISVQRKQVLHWFQNRRCCTRKKQAAKQMGRSPDKGRLSKRAETTLTAPPLDEIDISKMEFEAKSSKDGAWYDVHAFLAHRMLESGDPEVRVRFAGYGADEDEWVNVRSAVRQRSLPCEASECVSILPGDAVLCFQEGNRQALYYDAYVMDVERRRHDIRGCRCRFFVQYEHDGSTGIVPLKKVCRIPETECQAAQSVDNVSVVAATDTSK